MRKLALAVTAVSAFALAPSANAANLIETYTPGDPEFTVSGDVFSGPISADLSVSGIVAGDFTHTFSFTIPQTGVGSGSVTTSASFLGEVNDTDFTSVLFNGTPVNLDVIAGGLVEIAWATDVPITAGVLNNLVINGVSRGNGSYGGQLTFTPVQGAIPEPSTWAMMLFGFGAVGFGMRRRKNGQGTKRLRVSYS
jgi:hypothetical protein